MPLSLDDVLNAPTDPTLLNRHLQTLGLVPAPMAPTAAAPAAPTTVAPMAPRTMPTMTPPVKTHETVHVTDSDPGPEMASHAEIGSLAPPAPRVPLQPLNVAGLDARQPETATPDAVPGGIQPMVPPTPSAGSSLLNAPRKTLESFKSREQDAPDIDRIAPVGQGPQLVEPGTAAYDRNKIDRMEDEKHNHYGTPENHPGVIGKILHGLAKAGNIAGNIVAPGTMALIPGTDLNKQVEEGRTTARMEREQEGETKAKHEETLSKSEEARANEENARAQRETAQIENDRKKLELEINKENTPERQAFEHLVKQGSSPSEAFERIQQMLAENKLPREGELPLGQRVPQLNAALAKRFQVLHPGKTLPEDFRLADNATQKDFDRIDKVMEATEKSEGTEAQRREANEMRRETIALMAKSKDESPANKEFDTKQAAEVVKDNTTARAADFRLRSMQGSYDDAVKHNDQQAMLNILSNHVGMTLGLQKGARITKDFYHEAESSAPWLARIGAKFDDQGYLSGVTLTKDQMDSMMRLGVQQRHSAWQQVHDSAEQAGLTNKIQFPDDFKPSGHIHAGGGGGARAEVQNELTPPGEADPGNKWQHRTVNGKTEWRQVKAQQ